MESSRERPAEYLAAAAALLVRRRGTHIVEIGSIRKDPVDELEGASTLVWGATGLRVDSVDIDPDATRITSGLCANYPNVAAINRDGIAYLRQREAPIDLLYLDGWDTFLGDSPHKHLEAFEAALPNLSVNPIVVIDDTDIDNSKGLLVIPYARSLGYIILWEGRQTLLLHP